MTKINNRFHILISTFQYWCRTMPNIDPSRIEGIVFDLDGTLIVSTIDFMQMRCHTFKRMKEAGVPEEISEDNKTIA